MSSHTRSHTTLHTQLPHPHTRTHFLSHTQTFSHTHVLSHTHAGVISSIIDKSNLQWITNRVHNTCKPLMGSGKPQWEKVSVCLCVVKCAVVQEVRVCVCTCLSWGWDSSSDLQLEFLNRFRKKDLEIYGFLLVPRI